MPVSLQLAISALRAKPVRALLACLTVFLAVTLMFTAGGGMDCLQASFSRNLSNQLGHTTARVLPAFASAHELLPFSDLQKIRASPGVLAAQGRCIVHMPLQFGHHISYANVVGIEMSKKSRVNPLRVSMGKTLSPRGPDTVVLNAALAAMLGAHVGDAITLGTAHSPKFILSGIVRRSAVKRFIAFPRAFIRLSVLRKFWPVRGLSRVDVLGKPGVNSASLAAVLRRELGAGAHVQAAGSARHVFARVHRVIRDLRFAVSIPTAISAGMLLLALSMVGLSGRVRELGRLRCIGASRRQILSVIVKENALIALAAIALGLPTGWLLVRLLTLKFSHFFSVFYISPDSLILAVATGLIAILIGSALPLWVALRAQPMSAFLVLGRVGRPRRVVFSLAAGGVLILMQIAFWKIPNPHWAVGFYLFFGVPMVLLAACLICPWLVLAMEKLIGPAMARLWCIGREFVSQNWVRSPYLAGAMAAALLAGMAFFVSMQSRGQGLLASWEFPAHFPDAFVFSPFQPIPTAKINALTAHVRGVRRASALTAFWVAGNIRGVKTRMLFVAVQPKSFIPMLGLKFVGGSSQQAQARLEHGRGIFVSPQSSRSMGLPLGSALVLDTLSGPRRVHVVGVAHSGGINIAQNYLRVGRVFHQTAAVAILGTLAEAKKWFGVPGCNMVMLSVDPQIHAMKVVIAVKKYLSAGAAPSVLGSLLGMGAMQLHGTSVRQMKRHLDQVITDVMRALSAAAIGAMLLGAVGVAIMIAASVRSRRYEFGILRALGASRSQILRIVISQVSVIIAAGVLIGIFTGIYLAFMATRVDHRMAGFDSRFIVAWSAILWGTLITAGLAILFAIWPAFAAARTGVRALVAEGRE